MMTALLALQIATAVLSVDPFLFFQPSAAISSDDRRRLDSGRAIARVLPAEGLEVAVLAAVPVDIDGDRLVAWIERIEQLKRSAYVLAIHRFSDPPRIDDLAGLTLEDHDLSEILGCRPDRCGLKLSAVEISDLQHAALSAGAEWKEALQQRFREILLTRVNAYVAAERVRPSEHQSRQVWPAQAFARLVDHSVFLTEHAPQFADYLRGQPSPSLHGVESFLYWSNERLANRPIVRITDVNIFRTQGAGLPDVLIAGKEIFSTHYVNASLGLTALMRGEPGGPNYLVYVNRSEVDVLGGMFGGLSRWVIQRRLKADAAGVLQALKRRLESRSPVTATSAELPLRVISATSGMKP